MSLKDYRTAFVTGASSGIGAAIARALAGAGLEVHACARRRDRLDELAATAGCTPHVLDVNEADSLYRALEELEIDILVNNAGLGRAYDGFSRAGREDIDTVIGTNVSALIHATRAVLPGMIERRRGHVVNLGSIAGMYPLGFSVYGASKGAVRLFSQNLRLELHGSGVRVTEICPGRVASEFFVTATGDPDAAAGFTQGLECLVPEDVAEAVMFALDAPWRCNVSTIELLPTEQTVGAVHINPVERTG
ncbi:MAG: SDR family NAD(P)-dependent oxidoreductase [Alphaproteobacteria bacterium]